MKQLLASALLITATACNLYTKDGSNQPIDAPPKDAANCEGCRAGEGGNLFFDTIHLDTQLQAALGLPQGLTTLQRAMAYFMDAQTPNENPTPVAGMCTNLDAGHDWPVYVGPTHTDLDVGSLEITGVSAAGNPASMVVPIQPAGTDVLGRTHDVFYQLVNSNVATYLAPDAQNGVLLGGAGTIPATAFTGASGVAVPADFTVNTPGIEDAGPLVAGTDFPVHWTPATSLSLLPGDEVIQATWLVDVSGKPTHLCVIDHSAGQFTIPGASIAEYKSIATARGQDPTHLVLLRQALVRHQASLPNDEPANPRRFDMLGTIGWMQLMNVQ